MTGIREHPPPSTAPAMAAQATGLLPDYDKCQAYIADVHSAFRSGS
jgi:hypothetical protein